MSVRKFRLYAGVFAIMGITAARASADPVVIYNNFGPSPGYLSAGWTNSDENAYYMGFQPIATAQLTSVTLPVQWAAVLPGGGFSVSLYRSSGGAPDFSGSGSGLIEQIVVPLPADAQPRSFSVLTLTSTVQPTLSAGTLYFLGAVVTPPSSLAGISTSWPMNNAGIQGLVVNSTPGGVFITQRTLGAFQVNGELSPTPEPATVALFSTGLGLIAYRRRRWSISRVGGARP